MKDNDNNQFPPVITLCGSTRYPDVWKEYNARLSMAGCIILSVGLFGHMEGMDMAGELKKRLDRLHFDKIRMSDAIFVLNKDGYIGLSAWDEIFYAISRRVSVFFLEPLKGDCAREFRRLLDIEGDFDLHSLGNKRCVEEGVDDTTLAALFVCGNTRCCAPYETADLARTILPFCEV